MVSKQYFGVLRYQFVEMSFASGATVLARICLDPPNISKNAEASKWVIPLQTKVSLSH